MHVNRAGPAGASRMSSAEPAHVSARTGLLPVSFLTSFYECLKGFPRVVAFGTFDELPFPSPDGIQSESDMRRFFRAEYGRWKRERKGRACHVFVQHDCDNGPEATIRVCRMEADLGVSSTTSVFARYRYRGREVVYPIDYAELRRLQDSGRVTVSYHTNVLERLEDDETDAAELFEQDVRELEAKGLKIRFFSPHSSNHKLFYPSILRRSLVWTHNRFGPIGSAKYSDGGGPVRLARGDESMDLRLFMVRCLRRGGRLFVLLHPEYYVADRPDRAEEFFRQNPWLAEFWRAHDLGTTEDYWKPLRATLEKASRRSLTALSSLGRP